MSSPSALLKVNYLVMRYLHFGSLRGDLQEGYFALPEANFLSSRCQSPSSRAQNRGFCAFLAFETLVFGHFEHKIGVFVLFWGLEPPFSGISSTKSRFLCAFGVWNPRFQGFRAQNRHFCAQEEGKVGLETVTAETLTTLPSHQRTRTHRHQQRPPAMAPAQQRHQEPLLCRLVPFRCRYGRALD